MRHDLFFVEWGNVRFGGTFSELATFAAELQAGMTKALAGDAEDKAKGPTLFCPRHNTFNSICDECVAANFNNRRWDKPLYLISRKGDELEFNK